MKKLNMAAVVALSLAASAAYAGTTTLDFQGFTITVNADGMWDQAKVLNTQDLSYYSWSNGYTPGVGSYVYDRHESVRQNFGLVSFTTSTPPELESYHGAADASAALSFSYTITAKPDWQLLHTDVEGSQSGSYFGFNGGKVSVSGSSSGSQVGGVGAATYDGHGLAALVGLPPALPGTLAAGTFTQNVSQQIQGNYIEYSSPMVHDAQGWHYDTIYQIDHYTDPLTAVTGHVALNLGVSSIGNDQVAYIAASPDSLTFRVAAARVGPVPEPETYAMVLASLGLFGALARRKKN